MPSLIEIRLEPDQAANPEMVKEAAALTAGISLSSIQKVKLIRSSIDARKKPIVYLLKLEIYTQDEQEINNQRLFQITSAAFQRTCHIIGFGPAGIFAALQCLERGIKPIVIERGKEVKKRIGDISAIHKKGHIDADSNYCFGEGGAGTYSDGKLYTRSSKRGDIKKVLDTFIQHGADPRIGIEAHPHIGTNKLPRIIEHMRQYIIECGGEVHFEKRWTDFDLSDGKLQRLHFADGDEMPCEQLILATGHSARDVFDLLYRKGVHIEAKPFALGVRIEHQQSLIDKIQYKQERGANLPAASYSLVTQACGRGVFSFCMCPGGVIAPAGTQDGEIVVNGWSSSARNGPYSNSGIVVEVQPLFWQKFANRGALAAMAFQQYVEQKAFALSGSLIAPAQRMEDFIQKKRSSDLPRCSYQPGLMEADLDSLLPGFIRDSLRQGLIDFGKKMPAYRTNEAVLVAVESRSSSPVRIPRDKESFRHPQIKNLFPCGEGAGYAGGIVSAAMDGMACALKLDL